MNGYKTGIHEFGSKAALNLNRKSWLFPDNPPAIHVYYKTAAKTVKEMAASGSIFSAGSLAMGFGGLVIGGTLGALVMWMMSRRRRKDGGLIA